MLSITAVSANAIDYLLRGCGCTDHEHVRGAPEHEHERAREQSREQGGPERAGAEYLISGAEKEPAGVWWGQGLSMVGMSAGQEALEADVRAIFGQLRQPTSTEKDPVYLGRKPRTFRSVKERTAAALAAEPDATDERKAQIRHEQYVDQRKAVGYYDLTFSPAKSVSVYYAGLVAQGRTAEAEKVMALHRAAVQKAMGFVETEAAYVRSGYHGKTAGGRSVGRYERATGLVAVEFDHRTSRAQEPQMHAHFAVLNRAVTERDGEIRAVDGKGFRPIKMGADAIYMREVETGMTAEFPVVFALRPDGKAREILGMDRGLLASGSSRREQLMKRTDELVAKYRDQHDREPGPAALKRIRQEATFETREGKTDRGPLTQIRDWGADKTVAIREMFTRTAGEADRVGRDGHPDQRGYADRTLDQVLHAAVEQVQTRYATWELGNLIDTIREQQNMTPEASTETAEVLAAQVAREPARYGIALVSAPDPAPVPEALQRADGKSDYRPHNDERYATLAHLGTETGLVALARQPGAPALVGPVAELARVELEAAGLSADQQAAVLDVVGSGRGGDVLIGPAGAGKSRTVAGLAQVWQTHTGGRVVGLATAQIATNVLVADGLEGLNTAQFLARFAPDEDGLVRDRVQAGDLVVLDEANMSDTGQVARIAQIVAAGGGKLVYTGDTEQLVAVGAGGILELLIADTGAAELSTIHRFREDWENTASVQLRVGDPAALAAYEEHGRLRAGSRDEIRDLAVRGYLADIVDGKTSVLVVRTNDEARDLSGMLRAELVALGRVEPEVLATLRDTNLVGVGDVVQARQIDRTIRVDGPGYVTNKATYTVEGRDQHGYLLVRSTEDGVSAHLPDVYVAKHLTLAYAATVHAAEGITVDTGHALVDASTPRNSAYPAGTRGRECNTFYVETAREPDHHEPERMASTARAVLEQVLTHTDQGVAAAETTRRAGLEDGRSLASVGTQWDLLTAEYAGDRYTDTLTHLLGADRVQQLVAEPGWAGLLRATRAAELAGHDPAAVLTQAVGRGSLAGANSVTDVLRARVGWTTDQRIPERDTDGRDWSTLTEPLPGPAGDYARALAEAATERQAELGAAAAADPPAWALESRLLGVPPAQRGGSQHEQDEWVQRAGVVAAYRELRNLPDTSISLGAAPSPEQEFHRALWRQAHRALGSPVDALDYQAATDAELAAMRARYDRERAFAPYYVAEEIADTRAAARDQHNDAILFAAAAAQHPEGSPDRELADIDVAAARQAAAELDARAAHLEVIHRGRGDWVTEVEAAKDRHRLAGDELERRGLARDPATTAGEQLAAIDVVEPDDQRSRDRAHDRTREGGGRDRDPAQQRLDLSVDRDPVRPRGKAQQRAHERDERVTVTREPGTDERTPREREHAMRDQQPEHSTTERDRNEPNRAVGEERQDPLFGITPRPVDTAAAAALRAPDPVEPVADVRAGSPERATSAEGWSEEPGPVTVGEARRQAEISAAMRAERDRWDTTMAAGVDQAQRRNATDRDGLDRERRDQPLHQDRSLAADLVRDRGYDATLTEGRGPSRESDRGRDRSDEAGMGIEP
ncbi:MobF family relaxase [Pseudonocardia parietis]|uniref:Conjugative relaxase-like TrwC/TraI family protein n=1 Tax=Pseudonocardia parietis TaxID=570936 RepID=A0ABS4W5P5_9PSEU|nr:MobF family relaxase [Pseudonocardia parietis]MBP2371539.1 conjugative relaxase-like TrwC/TraI family protein [Pseudonocardia parietis]